MRASSFLTLAFGCKARVVISFGKSCEACYMSCEEFGNEKLSVRHAFRMRSYIDRSIDAIQ